MSLGYTHDVFISFNFQNQLVADKIVNQLTNQYSIPCWICTEQIHAGENFRTDITEAIQASKIVVLVQSQLSAISPEVRQEIVEAFEAQKTIMPFKIEESQLRGVLQSLLKDIHYIDATKPSLDDRIYDLAQDICKKLGRPFITQGNSATENQAHLVSTPNVLPKSIFLGRDNIVNEIHDRFSNGEHLLFLQGIGGIGKTQIAKQYAKKYKDYYDTIIYATYGGSIRELILADSPFSIEPALSRYTLSDGTQESDDAYFIRKLEAIQKLSTSKTLIILDNFDVNTDEDLPMFANGNYDLLITTRNFYSREYTILNIPPIDSIHWLKEIFLKNYDGYVVEKDDPALEELIELVNRHTYTIELLAQHMENSGQTPTQMIAALKEKGISSLDEEVRNSDMKTQVAYENLLKMFQIFSLTQEERQLLTYLSLMPIEGVDPPSFQKWANLKTPKMLISLEKRSWIIRNINGIALHPVIRDVVKHESPATQENCKSFIDRFTQSIDEKIVWHLRKDEKDRLSNIAKSILGAINTITPETEDFYYSAEVIMSFSVDPLYAEQLAKRLLDYYQAQYGETAFQTGRAAHKLGWLYAFNSHLPNAHENATIWLTKAVDLLSRMDLKTSDEISKLTQSQVNLAKLALASYTQTNELNYYRLAKDYAIQAIEKTSASFLPGDAQYAKVAGAHWQLADVLLCGGELDEALSHIETALNILIPLHTEDNGDSAHAINRKAAILYTMGKYEEALPLAQKSVNNYIAYIGKYHPIVVGMYSFLGDCCVALGKQQDAFAAYDQALQIAQMLYAPGAQQIADINAKLIGVG